MLIIFNRYWVWRNNYCTFPFPWNNKWQGSCPQQGFLKTEPTQPDEFVGHHPCVWHSRIFTGYQNYDFRRQWYGYVYAKKIYSPIKETQYVFLQGFIDSKIKFKYFIHCLNGLIIFIMIVVMLVVIIKKPKFKAKMCKECLFAQLHQYLVW